MYALEIVYVSFCCCRRCCYLDVIAYQHKGSGGFLDLVCASVEGVNVLAVDQQRQLWSVHERMKIIAMTLR